MTSIGSYEPQCWDCIPASHCFPQAQPEEVLEGARTGAMRKKGCKVAWESRHSSSSLLFSDFTLLPTPPRTSSLKLIVCGQAGQGRQAGPYSSWSAGLRGGDPLLCPHRLCAEDSGSAQRILSLRLLYRGMKELAGQRGWGS